MTDEHNLRTLGTYRKYFRNNNQPDQANTWGTGNFAYTPNIDKLAREGALFTNFYTNAPSCVPSRSAFMTGLYPKKTGAFKNGSKMKKAIKTWAHVLQSRSYQTSYLGKWHLDGKIKPGAYTSYSSQNRQDREFGFNNNFYRYNSGHFKFLNIKDGKLKVYRYDEFDPQKLPGGMETHFTTDYLFAGAKKQIRQSKKAGQPFAVMISIPDPHSPNQVRRPYDKMYEKMHFNLPNTMWSRYVGDHIHPEFDDNYHNDVLGAAQNKTEKELTAFENGNSFQTQMSQYLGMVKCIDDNVGALMNFLKTNGLEDNTIVVFTSDHGDMLYEHGKIDKGLPHKTSAGVPFIVKYPQKIKAGKVVETAYSHIDFAPTMLSLMGIDHNQKYDGNNFSEVLTDSRRKVNDVNTTTFISHPFRTWMAVISSQYKLVLGNEYFSVPWLFDMVNDPGETVNVFNNAKYNDVKKDLLNKLLQKVKENQPNYPPFPQKSSDEKVTFYWDTEPTCANSRYEIPISTKAFCHDLGNSLPTSKCKWKTVREHCPVSCDACCSNTQGRILVAGNLYRCGELKQRRCKIPQVKRFCPLKCGFKSCDERYK